MADTASAGLIDTGKAVQQYNVLMQAGVKITDQQFATLAARATELAKATGQDATEAFVRLTNAVRSGSTEAFREYGVNLRQSTKLTDTHKNAIKGLTEGYENLQSKAETTTERLDILKNNISTAATVLWSSAGSSDTMAFALDEVNQALSEFNRLMTESPDAMKNFMTSADGFKALMAEVGLSIMEGVLGPLEDLEEWFENNDVFLKVNKMLAAMPLVGPLFQGLAVADVNVGDLLDVARDSVRDYTSGIWDEHMTMIEAETRRRRSEVFIGPAEIMETGGDVKKKRREKELHDPDQGFLEEDLEFQRMQEEFWTEQRNQRLEQERIAKEQEREMELQRIQESTEWQTEYFLFLEEEENKRRDRQQLGFFADQQTLKATEVMWKKSLQSRAQMMGGFFGTIGQLQKSENEKAWKIGKAANIAKTAIDTYTGAIAAYKAMAGIPYVGPVLGAAAAAAITVMGLQAIRNIKATNFTDEGQPGFVPETAATKGISSGSSGSSFSAAPTGASQYITQTERQEMTVNIVMKDEGMGLFDVVMDQNDRASKDGRQSLITSDGTTGASRAA
jgi:hypothetical protein